MAKSQEHSVLQNKKSKMTFYTIKCVQNPFQLSMCNSNIT